MTLLVKYKCEHANKPKHVYQLSTREYQAYRDVSNKSKQDINTSELRERDEQSQIRENCFEVRAHLVYVPAFTNMKDFYYNRPARLFGATVPTMSSLKNSWTRKSLTCSRKNSTCKVTSLPRPHLYNFPI